MPIASKEPLTFERLAEVLRWGTSAGDKFSRIIDAVSVTMPVATVDRWIALDRARGAASQAIRDLAFDLYLRNLPDPPDDPTGDSARRLHWFRGTRAGGNRKRDLAMVEWVVIGEEIKELFAMLDRLTDTLKPAHRHHAATWDRLHCRTWRAVVQLSNIADRQHPNWYGLDQAFKGEPIDRNPQLAAKVDPFEVNLIREMGPDEVYRHKPGTTVSHWSEILPIPVGAPAAPTPFRPRIYRPA